MVPFRPQADHQDSQSEMLKYKHNLLTIIRLRIFTHQIITLLLRLQKRTEMDIMVQVSYQIRTMGRTKF